jgi:signal transduction histidine kinase
MKRPWHVWLAFALCGMVLAAAMGWLTVHALRVDRDRSLAQAKATLEQNVSLALWRMDTKLAPLIAEEATRPHELYESFITVSTPATKGGATSELVPSPLLTKAPDNVLLNFLACPSTGDWISPQAPPDERLDAACDNGLPIAVAESNRAKLNQLARVVDVSKLVADLPVQPLPSLKVARMAQASTAPSPPPAAMNTWELKEPYYANSPPINAPAFDRQSGQIETQQQAVANGSQTSELQEDNPFEDTEQQAVQQPVPSPQQQRQSGPNADFASRGYRFQQAAEQEFNKQQIGNLALLESRGASASPTIEYVSRPVWVGDELLLARRVDRDGVTCVQGSWLDWPRLKSELLAESADLLPDADLLPVRGDDEAAPTRMLAGLPVKLVVDGRMNSPPAAGPIDGPLQWALSFGWLALALAFAAVALLLWGVLALSERRAAFVSSVTHELRTPLTTFRLYADMLARDMAPTPERRREYLETLKTEAERLTHLVENVLSYARLERGRRPQRTERTTPSALVDRFEPRLAERAAQAGMTLTCDVEEASANQSLITDVGVVEQILFNLVDNAAKYAGRASDRRITLSTARDGKFILLAVHDYGPGFASAKEAARSAPFSKSAQEAAETAPGVGLGLALCRRLAKELGGRLDIAPRNGEPGATVTLLLPAG